MTAIPYPIGAVSKLTGISVDTLRAWERRYSAVVPRRGDRRRGYDQAEVERLILLRRATERGHSISSVAGLPDAALRDLLRSDTNGTGAGSTKLIQPLLASLEEFDYAALNQRLSRLAAVLPPAEIAKEIVLPVMREVGERWHRGQLTVAQEHLMSGLMNHLLGALLALYRPQPNAAKLIFTTPEGEHHSIGVLVAAMLAGNVGLSPIYLGPSLPVSDIVLAARRSRAKAVVLQVTDTAVDAGGQVRRIMDGLPAGVETWIGGDVDLGIEGIVALRDFEALDPHYQRLAVQ